MVDTPTYAAVGELDVAALASCPLHLCSKVLLDRVMLGCLSTGVVGAHFLSLLLFSTGMDGARAFCVSSGRTLVLYHCLTGCPQAVTIYTT